MPENKVIVCPECGSVGPSTDKSKFAVQGKNVRAREWVYRYRCKKCLRVFTPPAGEEKGK